LEPFAAGSFPALQFNPSQKQFVAFGNVPETTIYKLQLGATKQAF
jgi:hypothetical protein